MSALISEEKMRDATGTKNVPVQVRSQKKDGYDLPRMHLRSCHGRSSRSLCRRRRSVRQSRCISVESAACCITASIADREKKRGKYCNLTMYLYLRGGLAGPRWTCISQISSDDDAAGGEEKGQSAEGLTERAACRRVVGIKSRSNSSICYSILPTSRLLSSSTPATGLSERASESCELLRATSS